MTLISKSSSSKKTALAIKTGVTKRLVKELIAYKKEFIKQTERIDALKADDPQDTHMIKKQVLNTTKFIHSSKLMSIYLLLYLKIEVLDETRDIIPDCAQRLANSIADLEKLILEQNDNVLEIEDANNVIKEASMQLEIHHE